MRNIVLDLSGEEGNAFFIMGFMKRYFEFMNVPKSTYDEYIKEAISGDYNTHLDVSQEYCPELVYVNRE